jgi:acyl-coenzyme A synthetase/AMP-(fatty) acid ligase
MWRQLGELDGTEAWNFYGPTECTVDTVVARVRDRSAPVIGRPVDGTTAYVLDGNLLPVPAGVTGELYLGGAQVARGYLGQPALTAERFVADPFGEPGGRLYRSGDMVRWTAAGDGVRWTAAGDDLAFVGRSDDQVKVRGYRIEPGEVEAALGQLPEVEQVAVVPLQSPQGATRLVAYAVTGAGAGAEVDGMQLRRDLVGGVPEHMLPAAVMILEHLPVTPNGKLDRDALPVPDFSQMVTATRPRGPVEATLVELFASLLDLDTVGIHDDFLDLGGDSLLAMRLARLASGRDLPLTPRDVLLRRTPAALAAVAAVSRS